MIFQFSALEETAQLFDFSNFQYARIFDFIESWQSYWIFQNLKILGIFITLVLLIILVWLKIKTHKVKPKPSLIQEISPPQTAPGGPWQARWEEIKRHIDSPKEGEWKFAVIEADALMNDALKRAGFAGETMGERLQNIQSGQIQNLDALWEAHKIRNRLAHDSDYFLRYAEAKRAVSQFEKILKELGVL
ncbi:MAG: hypothetical protein A3G02_03175 [Candidatus Yanofskybacteria bacterium RIFCSPLOWO2_12_FULL_44_13b]|uniref:Uncharacterized protein n=2 Tax=Parcubacteria group TaxID=1794811 RepID=A0A1F8H0M8_9BACT|nr:MAG: hypothetical protein UU38_C0009G0009 [Candidatus Wolfebacteria bacterium GW2011_GWB1_41_12]KKT28316.1 MAG: hypothetical protein UW14_C0010G0020 [Candidatus Yanofskybacteria bacterium GW2011_GWA2_44_10]OGN03450.1 MAG: hypothetical protein A2657_02930 [Candidatus Yanofskybacteria bacterium RIFCSPHIGHO2_01_FULL_44_110b]OGN14682.1 MAG: hypothetical protein A3C01_02635 [Candidatus Yanofskybacteria bacterium RIFCSPHIGHO2_02_FULL_44_36b]OGN18856.1 MAG: hypothetical protein A3F50_02690 [Candida